jgi:hypothetical protein
MFCSNNVISVETECSWNNQVSFKTFYLDDTKDLKFFYTQFTNLYLEKSKKNTYEEFSNINLFKKITTKIIWTQHTE